MQEAPQDFTKEMTRLIEREDGRIERICKHGVGHTIDAPKEYKKRLGKQWSTHGCCQEECCQKWHKCRLDLEGNCVLDYETCPIDNPRDGGKADK